MILTCCVRVRSSAFDKSDGVTRQTGRRASPDTRETCSGRPTSRQATTTPTMTNSRRPGDSVRRRLREKLFRDRRASPSSSRYRDQSVAVGQSSRNNVPFFLIPDGIVCFTRVFFFVFSFIDMCVRRTKRHVRVHGFFHKLSSTTMASNIMS